jgi:putative hemolysin
MTKIKSHISLANVLKPKNPLFKRLVPVIDKIMGIHKVKEFYENGQLYGRSAEEFSQQFFNNLEINISGSDNLAEKTPNQGSLIVVANHPFGCVEGVALAQKLKQVRPDVKVLANNALSMFTEISEYFIFINPLSSSNPENAKAIRQCKQHLNSGGVLLIFPAGKVSYFRPEKQRICDDVWNRLPANLAKSTKSPVLPIFIEGHNSQLFINLGRIYYRFKLIMLFREMLKHKGKPINLHLGHVLPNKLLAKFEHVSHLNEYLRVQTYLLDPNYQQGWPDAAAVSLEGLEPKKTKTALPQTAMAEIMPQVDKTKLKLEIDLLPEAQHLVDYKTFSVYYGKREQMPLVVQEITRLRELVFRQYDEGSGEECDTDEFDDTYLHLFIYNQTDGEIIGAYRMGQSDVLLKDGDINKLYLAKMFEFSPDFINQQQPCLEMGRSFLVPEHQKTFYGLFLLWRGIGEFVVRHPQYRTLYGTVSLSKLYSPLSVHCINQLAVTPSDKVAAKSPFEHKHNPELADYIQSEYTKGAVPASNLSSLIMGIEQDGKDVPVLMKHYQRMGARFYCVGIDKSFNDTPGLLLSVDLPKAPDKALKQYLAEGKDSYLDRAC